MSKTNRVAEAYNQNQEREWMRLSKDPYHCLEFLVTRHHLQEHLPPSGVILDAGGGPARYALELCRTGYKVILLDIASGLISLAQDQFKAEPDIVQERLIDSVYLLKPVILMQYCAWKDHYHTSVMKPVGTGHCLSWCGLPGLELLSVYPLWDISRCFG